MQLSATFILMICEISGNEQNFSNYTTVYSFHRERM